MGGLLLLLVTLFVSVPPGHAQPLIDLSFDMDGVSTQAEVRYLEDAAHTYSAEQVKREPLASKFAPLPHGKSNLGISSSDFWLRIDVQNSGSAPLSWFLEAIYPQWDHVTFYLDGAKPLATGDHEPFLARAVAVESNVYPVVTLPGAQQRIWVHFSYQKPGLAETQLQLWTPEAFYLHYASRYFVIGAFIGIGLLLVLYNLLIGYATRMPEYIWYTSYVLAAVFTLLSMTGLGSRYLWPDTTWFMDFSPILFPVLTLVLATQFTRMFLCTRQSRLIDSLLITVFVVGAIALLCYGLGWRDYALKSLFVCAIITIFYPLIGLWQYRKGRLDARFYVLGWSVWSMAMLIAMLRSAGVVPSDFTTSFAPALGFFIEGVLLSFALADRINRLRDEKEAMELTHIEHLELEQQTLERVVSERTAALQQAMKNAELLARTDALTGALNRRACLESGEAELDRARRYNTPLAVVMIDLDLFKLINDNYGHAGGDAVLVAVVEQLRAMTRTVDTIGRIGGEEFVLLLPQANQHDAAVLAERYRCAIEALDIMVDDLSIKVTASIGVACIDVSRETLAEAINRADAALYRAKASGRNRVELAEQP